MPALVQGDSMIDAHTLMGDMAIICTHSQEKVLINYASAWKFLQNQQTYRTCMLY